MAGGEEGLGEHGVGVGGRPSDGAGGRPPGQRPDRGTHRGVGGGAGEELIGAEAEGRPDRRVQVGERPMGRQGEKVIAKVTDQVVDGAKVQE